MITYREIPAYYDWLSRYVQLSNWLAYGDRFAAFTMHKRLAAPAGAGRTAGLEYVNDHLLEAAELPEEPRVLDAGCGFGGTILRWHERRGGRYDGLTLSRVQARVARREARRRGIDEACRFHVKSYDAELTGEYDAVVAIESLIHSPDLGHTISNLASVLAPGGRLVVLDDMASGEMERDHPREAELLRDHWGCARYPGERDYRDAIAGAGLRVVHEDDLTHLALPREDAVLDRLEKRYSALHRSIPLRPVRTIVSAYLGGIGLERLHGTGYVRYRLLVARRQEDGE